MSHSGNISESPSKSALEKAKRTAANAKQNLAEESSTATNADAKTPELDAVDISPVCIPRKSDPTPALVLALPVLPAHGILATTLRAPPATVIIPTQPFNPLPVQPLANLLCGNLTVPTIRSHLNTESIPIKFTYLMDVEDCSSEDELKSHIDLLSKNRRRRRRLDRKIKELAAKDENLKAKKPEEQYYHDAIDQKILNLHMKGCAQHVSRGPKN